MKDLQLAKKQRKSTCVEVSEGVGGRGGEWRVGASVEEGEETHQLILICLQLVAMLVLI